MPQPSTPQAVFWRRRLLAVAAAIALVWVVTQGVGRLTSSREDSKPEAPRVKSSSEVASAAPDGLVRVRLASAGGKCDPEQIRITPSVPAGQKNGGRIKVALTVSSKAKDSCVLQPDDAETVAIISAGDDAIWDSTACSTPLLNKPVKISARWSTVVDTEWSGRKSGSACSDREDWAPAGNLTLQIGTLGGEPGKTSFRLAKAPAPVPKPKPEESKSTPKPKPTTDSSAESSR